MVDHLGLASPRRPTCIRGLRSTRSIRIPSAIPGEFDRSTLIVDIHSSRIILSSDLPRKWFHTAPSQLPSSSGCDRFGRVLERRTERSVWWHKPLCMRSGVHPEPLVLGTSAASEPPCGRPALSLHDTDMSCRYQRDSCFRCIFHIGNVSKSRPSGFDMRLTQHFRVVGVLKDMALQ